MKGNDMDITRKRGDTKPDRFTVSLADTWEPANLAGCTFKLTLDTRQEPDDESTVVYSITAVSTAPASGVVAISPSPEQADRVGAFYYELQLTDAMGLVDTLVSGKYVYKQDIAK
jgi:hypothetical protein